MIIYEYILRVKKLAAQLKDTGKPIADVNLVMEIM